MYGDGWLEDWNLNAVTCVIANHGRYQNPRCTSFVVDEDCYTLNRGLNTSLRNTGRQTGSFHLVPLITYFIVTELGIRSGHVLSLQLLFLAFLF
jgi:hypothetical protein